MIFVAIGIKPGRFDVDDQAQPLRGAVIVGVLIHLRYTAQNPIVAAFLETGGQLLQFQRVGHGFLSGGR